jgi:DNA-binding NarL/FixJ family response regulator
VTISVLIADDHEVVRKGLVKLLEGAEFHVVAEVERVDQLLPAVRQYSPQAVLLDVRLGDHCGLEAIEHLRGEFAALTVVVLSNYDHPTYIARANALGANDYVLKSAKREALFEAINAAVEGGPLPSHSLMRPIREHMQRPARPVVKDTQSMSAREIQVLRHLALGLSNREIALSLGISIDTVKEHVQRAVHKLGVCDRTQAAVIAVKQGLVG